MQVKVFIERDRGVYRPPHAQREASKGDLHLTYRTSSNRRIAVLQLLGADRQWPNLYDPRLVELSAERLRFVGFECDDGAWFMQAWTCELQ